MLTVAIVALLAGFIGALTGVGGVVLVPALTEAARTPIDRAIGTAMFALAFSAPVAAYAAVRRVRLSAGPVALLCAGAACGSIVGTVTLAWFSGSALRLLVAAAALVSGLHALFSHERAGAAFMLGSTSLALLGFVVGWASAVTGTGGPILLIPILLLLGFPAAVAVGLALAAHVPIVWLASAVNLHSGRVDITAGAGLGGLLVAGTLAGMWLFTRLSGRQLTVCVALALLAVGSWYGYVTLAHQ